MSKKIITIAREFGSGGRMIGEKLAKKLEIPFYDKELITLTAQKSFISEAVVKETEQKRTNGFLYGMYTSTFGLPLTDQIFIAQNKVIHDLAQQGSCIIVGRCADYVLRDHPDCLRVFIHAPLPSRARRAKKEYGVDVEHLENFIIKRDKERANYYNYFTAEKWGKAQNYHLTVNSDIGLDKTTQLILQLIRSES